MNKENKIEEIDVTEVEFENKKIREMKLMIVNWEMLQDLLL